MLTIIVNGEQRAAKPGATVSDLLHEMSLDPGRVAIERNLEILSRDRKSTRLNSSHGYISYAVFCLKKKKELNTLTDFWHRRMICLDALFLISWLISSFLVL